MCQKVDIYLSLSPSSLSPFLPLPPSLTPFSLSLLPSPPFSLSLLPSPPPPQIGVHVTLSAVVAYSKVSLVVQLHAQVTDRDAALVLVAVVIQLGSLFGAILFFCLVYYTSLFSTG